MNRLHIGFSLIALVSLLIAVGSAAAQGDSPTAPAPLGTSVTYQGRLVDNSAPATGNFDFLFLLYDSPVGGAQVGSTIAINDLPASDGFFTAYPDFGASVFNGQARWLEVQVRPGASTGTYTVLSPRQALSAAPYALYSLSAPWSGLSGMPAGFADGIDNDTTYSAGQGLTLSGTTFSMNTGFTDGRYWSLAGNSGTNPASQYLGTSDNAALELRVNGARALRLEPNPSGPNVIGGFAANSITEAVWGATVFGGGTYSSSNPPNRVTDTFGTVSGGWDNQAGNDTVSVVDAIFATVGGGANNNASGQNSTVAGGGTNNASALAATVGGGGNNHASGGQSTIGGGYSNLASGDSATVSGGQANTASGLDATVGGGFSNTANGYKAAIGGGESNEASSLLSTVGGGISNSASGYHATVGGGNNNTAAGENSSVAGGGTNTAGQTGAAVGGGQFNSANGINSTVSGGFSNIADGIQGIVPGGYYSHAGGNYTFAAGTRAKAIYDGSFVWADGNDFDFSSQLGNQFSARATGGFRLATGIDGNGNVTWRCSMINGESWACTSDRNMKENFKAVDSQAILEKLSQTPILYWNAKGTDPNVKHLGPMAQDFFAAFGLGSSDTSISTIDLDGVALAAIQGLNERSLDQAKQIAGLQAQDTALAAENESLKAQLGDLEARLSALERGASPADARPSLWSYLPFLGLAALGIGIVWQRRGKRGEQ